MIRKPYEQFNTYKTLAFALTWFALEKKNIFLVFCDSAFGSKLEVYNKKKNECPVLKLPGTGRPHEAIEFTHFTLRCTEFQVRWNKSIWAQALS